MKIRRLSKYILYIALISCVALLILVLTCYLTVVYNADGRTYDSVDSIPHNKVGLLLATSPITPGGGHNYYFDNRIKAADELYKAGKVDFIIASGGDYTQLHKNGCDEPKAILDSLVARGVPTDRIILDYERTRTLNSIAKAKEVYGLDSLILISQKYHNERAIYLANRYGLHAIGYNAAPSPIRRNRIKNTLREYLARVKMFVDILFGNQPDFKESQISIKSLMSKDYSFLDLFYGMKKDSVGRYFDTTLDTISDLTHNEYSSIWYKPSDSVRFEMSMGIYLDNDYPTDVVKKEMLNKLNKVIPDGFLYDIDDLQGALLKKGVSAIQSINSFVDGWGKLFNRVTELNGYGSEFAHYPMTIGSRGCAVCHKIYEDSIWATYIIEMSVDYHSSCGCPSSADYYTINKDSGYILTIKDYIVRHNNTELMDLIQREYQVSAKAKGFEPSSGEELIKKADGIALLNEGILIYFYPYNIGFGAEGQYNLIIPLNHRPSANKGLLNK